MRPARLTPAGRLLVIAFALTAARLVAATAVPLTEDEAYYRLWAQHLQAGYFDHPPMIAWWIRLGETLAGDTALGVRLLPVLATGVTTWLVGDLARRLGLSAPAAERAALWYNATFTVALGGMLATPDTPACLFWTMALWALARRRQGESGGWWLLAGVAAGLACLSKYTGLFLAPGVLAWLMASPRGLAELRRPWPWLAALCAAAAFAPNVAWNAGHDWLTFDKQFGRVAGGGFRVDGLAEFLLTQFLLLNPLIAVLAARGAWRAWRERKAAPIDVGVLAPLAAALPFIVYLAVHSLHDRVQGHWPVVTFGALAICAAYAGETVPAWLRRAPTLLGLGLSALVLLHLAIPAFRFGGSDPALHVRAWPAFARDIEALRTSQGASWVGARSYGVAAQLAAQRRVHAPIVQIEDRQRYFDWQRGADLSGPGLVLDLERRMKASVLAACFAEVTPLGVIDRGHGRSRWTRYAVYRVTAPRRDIGAEGCP